MRTESARSVPALALLAASALASGCLTSTQRVSIECVPQTVQVFVDGRLLEADEDLEVRLRTDTPHKIFVKGGGFEPRLVVLEPGIDAEGNQTLGPDEVCIEVVPVGMRRDLELHPEADDEEGNGEG